MIFSFLEQASYKKSGVCPHRFNCANYMVYDCCGHDCWDNDFDLDENRH